MTEFRDFHLHLDSKSRRRSKIPEEASDVLRNWFLEHQSCPYPTRDEKKALVAKTGLSATQVRNWFTNIRKRHWAPVRKGREPRSFLDVVVQRHMLVEKIETHVTATDKKSAKANVGVRTIRGRKSKAKDTGMVSIDQTQPGMGIFYNGVTDGIDSLQNRTLQPQMEMALVPSETATI